MARKSKHKNVAGTMNDIDCLNNTGQPELQITPDLTRLLNVLRTRRLITILLLRLLEDIVAQHTIKYEKNPKKAQ